MAKGMDSYRWKQLQKYAAGRRNPFAITINLALSDLFGSKRIAEPEDEQDPTPQPVHVVNDVPIPRPG